MPQRKRTAVVGGGMAGCAATRELLRAGREVLLFESTGGLGGRARSWHRPEIEPDVGVNLWFTDAYRVMFDRIREYGLEDQLVPMANTVIIVDDGRPAELYSDSLRSLLTFPHVSLRDRIRFLTWTLRESMRRRRLDVFDPEKLAAFDDGTTGAAYASRAVSPRGLDNLLRPEIESFWLWRLEDVSAAHIRGMQANVVGAKFFVFRNGMEIIAERSAEGANIRLNCEVSDIVLDGGQVQVTTRGSTGDVSTDVVDEVVLATPAPVAAKLTPSLPDSIVPARTRRFIETQQYEPALSVAYLVDHHTMPSQAHIVPTGSADPPVKTIITFPKQARGADGRMIDKHLAFVYPGRAETRRLLDAPREEQFRRTSELVTKLWPDFPPDAEPFEVAVRPHAMPLPAPGRYRTSAEILQSQRGPVVFAGDYFCSPISEAAIRCGIRAADALLERR